MNSFERDEILLGQLMQHMPKSILRWGLLFGSLLGVYMKVSIPELPYLGAVFLSQTLCFIFAALLASIFAINSIGKGQD